MRCTTVGQCLSPANPQGLEKRDTSWAFVPHSPLNQQDILSRVQQEASLLKLTGRTLNYGVVCFRGYYPDTPYKANQDDYTVMFPDRFNDPTMALFGVFDGHGHVGEKCARYMSGCLPDELLDGVERMKSDDQIIKILSSTFLSINRKLHLAHDVDDTLSGTTAVTAMIMDKVIWVANVGDSRCILLQNTGPHGTLNVKALSVDQTPYRRDERARVRKYGARVLNMDMLEGMVPIHDDWDMTLGDEVDEGGDPPRIWAPDGAYPGTAFTRSIGDSIAEELGVTAEPEIMKHTLGPEDQLLIVASDGIWEFLTNRQVMEIAATAEDPTDAACLLWRAAYREWISKEVRTDDITVIVADLAGYYSGSHGAANSADAPPPAEKPKKTRRGSTKIEVGLVNESGEQNGQ